MLGETLLFLAISFSEILFLRSLAIFHLVFLEMQHPYSVTLSLNVNALPQCLQRYLCFFNLRIVLNPEISGILMFDVINPYFSNLLSKATQHFSQQSG